ncbi:MAG: flagellar protein FlgN [Clostridiales bacterium]|nr:flagellar protein FlgN [Clostridiales bacterium]
MEKQLETKVLDFLKDYSKFYNDFLNLEKVKLDDIQKGNYDTLDKHVRGEEAFVLKSRGLEKERIALMEQAGKKDATFSEIILMFSEDVRPQLQETFDKFSEIIFELKEVNAECNDLANLKLQTIQNTLKKMNGNKEVSGIYDQQAKNLGSSPSSFISRKI